MYTQPSRRDFDPKDRRIAFLIFGVLLVCYLITYTGIIQSSDGLAVFATAESMARRGAIDSNQLLWMGSQQGNLGPDGNLYYVDIWTGVINRLVYQGPPSRKGEGGNPAKLAQAPAILEARKRQFPGRS